MREGEHPGVLARPVALPRSVARKPLLIGARPARLAMPRFRFTVRCLLASEDCPMRFEGTKNYVATDDPNCAICTRLLKEGVFALR